MRLFIVSLIAVWLSVPLTAFCQGSADAPANVVQNGGLKVSSDKAAYTPGDVMKITVETPSAGFIMIYGVDSNGSTVILVPNPWLPDNSVKAGVNVFPADGAPYHF